MSDRYVPPGLEQSFNCPHCGALAHQTWFDLFTVSSKNNQTPMQSIRDDYAEYVASTCSDVEKAEETIELLRKIDEGRIFISKDSDDTGYARRLYNLAIAMCYACKSNTVWTSGKMISPQFENDIRPNADMPEEIKLDFLEAARILSVSPRGSAALLRLCVQKLCKFLGQKGKNINDDIAALVKSGLDERIQKALDIVRVIGNEAVHPGQIDLRDNQEIAGKLFKLVNLVADVMISQPKAVDDLFQSLPEAKRSEILRRDA